MRGKFPKFLLILLGVVSCLQGFLCSQMWATSPVVINEIHYDPDSPTSLTEYIELYNTGDHPVDLSGWHFSNGLTYVFPESSIIGSSEYLVITQNLTQFEAEFGFAAYGEFIEGRLSNDGETITLRDSNGNKVDEVDYQAEFPWPVSAAGRGPSMELLNPFLDNDLGGSWRSAREPSPGAQNSVYRLHAPPQIRQVKHSPQQPRDFESPTIQAKVTDPNLVRSVNLYYQVVSPGEYFGAYQSKSFTDILNNPDDPHAKNSSFESLANWTRVSMNRAHDLGEGIYTAVVPKQPNRTLVRYRIEATDEHGNGIRVPYSDDPSMNFAYFVYNGVPEYTATQRSVHPDGAGHVYSRSVMNSLPVYHLITDPDDYSMCYGYGNTKIPKSNKASRSAFHWYGTFVYDGIVYDHMRYRLRQANDRYGNINGKRSMRFRFNRGHLLQARDINGRKLPHKVRTINTGKMYDNKDVGNFGITETMNSLLWNMVDVPAPHTWWFHFRVIKSPEEQPDQYHGDFQGFNLVFEDYSPTFLKTHDLPDGNLYKLKDGIFNGNDIKRHQGTHSVTNDSDFQNIRHNLRPERSDAWLHQHVNYDKSFRYHTVNEAVRHFDVQPRDSHSKNRAWFFAPYPDNPLGRLWTLPWDSDASWGPNWGEGIDYSHNAAITGNGGKPDFVRDYKNFIREFRDLLWQEEVINPMIDELADKIRDFVPADRDRWKDAPSTAGSQDFGTMEWKVQDMKDFAFIGWSGRGGPDVPAGGRAAHLDSLAADSAIPSKPTLTYTGPADQPLDGITLQSSTFSDPQGNNTFGATQWRISEVGPILIPDLVRLDSRPKMEWFPTWDTGEIPGFQNTIRIPARHLVQGQTYLARVKHKDNTGRWSHWSEPISITPGPPTNLSILKSNLTISEIHYSPRPASTDELSQGYTSSDFEFIEFTNTGTTTLDLSDVRLTKGVDFDFPSGTLLEPNEVIVVVGNQLAFPFRFTNNVRIIGEYEGNLDNKGERVKLSLGAGLMIHEVEYDNKAPWKEKAGHSIVLTPLEESINHSSPVAWKTSPVLGGTPGILERLNAQDATFLITEFMASNKTTLSDEAGDYPDWIEILNTTNSPLSFDGWSLTDNPDNPTKWNFPDGVTLGANERTIVFASGKETFPESELHTNFKLSSSNNEFLSITNPEGVMVQMFYDYPEQRTDISYGLANDDLAPGYFTQSTPGEPNGETILGFVKDTKFSHDRGFYEVPFDLEIETETGGAEIYYTTDGSIPTKVHGKYYSGPIPIRTTTTIRAFARKAGFEPTNIDTQTYIFPADVIRQPANPDGFPTTWNGHTADYEMDPEVVDDPKWRGTIEHALQSIPSLSLVLDTDDMFSTATGIYPKGEDVEKPSSAELIFPDDQKGFQIDASVQVVGGSSVNRWKTDKLSLRLKFTSEYGPTKLEFPVFGEEAAQEFDTLVIDAHLNNVWSYGGGSSPTSQRQRAQYLRDQYISDLHRKLGGDSPYGYNIHLYINGLYWGMHTLHERPDENFVHKYRGGSPDDYDVMKHRTSTVVHGTNESYLALVATANKDLTSEANYQDVLQMLDQDHFINYMLLNFYLGNTDWGHQNWYASKHRTDPERKWQYHNWDAEHTMESLNQNAVRRNNNGGPTRIHQKLKLNSEYKTRFADLAYQHLYHDGVLSPEKSAEFYEYKSTLIERAIIAESARWGDNRRTLPYTKDDWELERTNLLNNYFPNRRDVVIQQLRSDGAYPSIDPPSFSQRGGEVSAGFELNLSSTNGEIYYTLNGTDPRMKNGHFSPYARRYTNPIQISGPSQIIRTRSKSGSEWSAIDEATFIYEPSLPTSENLIISEILYKPIAPTIQQLLESFEASDFEFLELLNIDPVKPLNLDGLQFTAGIQFKFPNGLVLDPGERVIIVGNLRAFESRYGSTANIAGEYSGKLDNGGETIRLISRGGQVIINFKYDDKNGWPEEPDTEGKSLIRLDPVNHPNAGSYTSWKASVFVGGNPGDPGFDEDNDSLPDDWEMSHFSSLNPAFDEDRDNDGLPNLLEYALNSDPDDTKSNGTPKGFIDESGHFTLTWTSPISIPSITFELEVSEDMQSWSPIPGNLIQVQPEDGFNTFTYSESIPAISSAPKFLRLRVTSQ